MSKAQYDAHPDHTYDPDGSAGDIGEWIESIRGLPDGADRLIAMLPEQLPLYTGRAVGEVVRIRGYILSSLEKTGLPPDALPYVLEELESSHDPYLVAAAAKALRGLHQPGTDLAPFLLSAINNIRTSDDALSFGSFHPRRPLSQPTTATTEILRTFAWLGPLANHASADLEKLSREQDVSLPSAVRSELQHAIDRITVKSPDTEPNCCDFALSPQRLISSVFRRRGTTLIRDLELEDQDGNIHRFGDFTSGSPTIVAFFYTRCDNPQKCSLTVTKLAHLQQTLQARGVLAQIRIAAFTYDPGFDLPQRLKAYGESRGIKFDQGTRFFRTTGNFAALRQYFDLGVNYLGSIVNRHKIELYLLDGNGEITSGLERLQWDIADVADRAQALLVQPPGSQLEYMLAPDPSRQQLDTIANGTTMTGARTVASVAGKSVLSVLAPLVIAFFPKCPMCWAAYLGVIGIGGLQRLPYSPWLLPVFIVLLATQLVILYRRARRTNRMASVVIAFAGALMLLIGGLHFGISQASYAGIGMMVAGSLLNALPTPSLPRRRSLGN